MWCPNNIVAYHGSYTTYEFLQCGTQNTAIIDSINGLNLNQCPNGPCCRANMPPAIGNFGQIVDEGLYLAANGGVGLPFSPVASGFGQQQITAKFALSFMKPGQPYQSYAVVYLAKYTNMMFNTITPFATAYEVPCQSQIPSDFQTYMATVGQLAAGSYLLPVMITGGAPNQYLNQVCEVLAVNWQP